MIPILILAAGNSSRMRGRDKLQEIVDGQLLLARQVSMAKSLGGAVFVAIGPDQPARRALVVDAGGVPMVIASAADGMGATLRDAVSGLPPCSAFMVLLADLPALQSGDLKRVMQAYDRSGDDLIWRAATADGRPGHPIIFADILRSAFVPLDGDSGAAAITAAHADQTRLVPLDDNRARLDLDTPEDWAAWHAGR